MIRLCAAILSATILAPAAQAQVTPGALRVAAPLVPDTVLSPPGGPRIVLLTSPGEGVAALRLAVPLREGPPEAGAGRLLRDLALERMRTLARPVGAEVAVARTPWGIAYSVVGAAADFEYLAYLLREAVAPPDVDGPAFAEGRLRLRGATAQAVESPFHRVAADLRSQVSPGVGPLEGTPGSSQAMDGARVRELWLRTHQSSAMTLVVSAPVVPEVVLAATRAMGAPEESARPPLDTPVPAGVRQAAPQVLRTWYGEAWAAGSGGDPHAPVVASLVASHLESQAQGFEASVELWELPERWVLAVVGAAYGRDVAAMRRAVSGAMAGARDALDASSVARATARIRSDAMQLSRTPAGLVSVVGRAMEGTGDPMAAAEGLEALLAVDAESTRRFLDGILLQPPRTAQVRP
ncbi:MAG: hypothetical protein Q8N53_14410 [Longimicrobiales bacterium]|nr:hypothetical protein [Longimicrobiales bacterium]